MQRSAVVFKIFDDGKFVCLGAKKEEDIYKAAENLRYAFLTEREIREMISIEELAEEELVNRVFKFAEEKLKNTPISE